MDYLIAEVRELRLILRDAVLDSTPGNRVWREGVKAGLEAAASCDAVDDATAYHIRAIDPSTILPAP